MVCICTTLWHPSKNCKCLCAQGNTFWVAVLILRFCVIFTDKLSILQNVFKDAWASKYVNIKEICNTLKSCHVIMPSLLVSGDESDDIFLSLWIFFFFAVYSIEYESKWKMEFKIFSMHFIGLEDKTVLLERQRETFRKWQLFNSILSTWHNKVKTLNFILLLSSTMSLQK